jgi:kynurenine formamidase
MNGNKGRWGADDERGTLNLITAAVIRDAAALVLEGRILSLAQSIHSGMKLPGHRAGVMHFLGRDGGDYAAGARRPGGFQFSEDTIVMPLHCGTHMDALCHCWHDDTLFNGFDQNVVRSAGSARLGIDKAGPIFTRGILLDFVKLAGGPLPDGTAIGPGMVNEAVARTGATIAPGDAVLLRTGWQERHESLDTPDFNAEPGLDLEAAQMLAEAGAALIGADNYAVEVLPFAKGTVFPVHQCLIADYGMPLLEGLVLAPLAEAGATTFLFAMAPLPIRGATGSPVNPMAVL